MKFLWSEVFWFLFVLGLGKIVSKELGDMATRDEIVTIAVRLAKKPEELGDLNNYGTLIREEFELLQKERA